MSINFHKSIFFKNQNFNVSPQESNPNTYSSNVLNNTSFVIKDAEYETNQITKNTKKRALTEFKTMQLSKKEKLQHHAFSKIETNISDSELFSPEDAAFLDSLDELPRVDTIEAETTDSFVNNILSAEYETNQITENTKKRALTEFKTMQLSKKQELQHHAFSKIETNISDSELFSPEDAAFLDSLDELPRVDKNLSRDDTIEVGTTNSSLKNILSAKYETNQITENTKKQALIEFKTMQLSKKQKLQHEDILSCKRNYFFKYIRKHERNDKKIVLNAVCRNGYSLKYASDKLKNDKEIVLAAVRKNGLALEYASHKLKDDKEVVLTAVRTNGYVLKYTSDNLKGDKEIVLTAVNHTGATLQYANENLRSDKEVVLAAVNHTGGALQYANENLRSDKEVVLAAVNQSGGALQYASENLKSDKEVILTAVTKSAYSFIYVRKSLKLNKEFVLDTLNQNARILPYTYKAFRDDEEIVVTAVRKAPYCLKYASARLQSNPECLSSVRADILPRLKPRGSEV